MITGRRVFRILPTGRQGQSCGETKDHYPAGLWMLSERLSVSKDGNTTADLLVGFADLYRVWPDTELRKRLDEMLCIVRDRFVVAPGVMHMFRASRLDAGYPTSPVTGRLSIRQSICWRLRKPLLGPLIK